jgi:hypothetical protein
MQTVTIGDVQVLPLLDTGLLMNPHYFFPQHADQAIAEYPDLLDERQLLRRHHLLSRPQRRSHHPHRYRPG